jgi:hypothetical protein
LLAENDEQSDECGCGKMKNGDYLIVREAP